MDLIRHSKWGFEKPEKFRFWGMKGRVQYVRMDPKMMNELGKKDDEIYFTRVVQDRKDPKKLFILIYFESGDYSEKEGGNDNDE